MKRSLRAVDELVEVRGVVCQRVVGRAQVGGAARRQHEHARALQHAGQAVRHQYHARPSERAADGVQDLTLRFVVQVSRRLVY